MIVWVFPGQGSQSVGMGTGLKSEAARETFAIANEVLGWDVRAACLEGTEASLGETKTSQPAILTVSVAAARSLEACGSFPDAVAGHSVGEFAALVAARAMSFEDALRAVTARADAMARAGRAASGGMAAILGLALDDVERLCRDVGGHVGIAAINGRAQIVISGERDVVEAVAVAARAAGARRVIPLNVSVAAHSTLMEPASVQLKRALESVSIRPPRVPFVSCVSGGLERDPSEISDLLCGALTRPVRWVDTVEALAEIGATGFREVGPGRVLTGLVRGILPDANVTPVGDDEAIAPTPGRPRGERRPMMYAAITGWGMAVPSRVVTNGDLARDVPGVDEGWILRRSGIRERRVAGPSETTASLATDAARRALTSAGRTPEEVDLVVVATCTPDRLIPATAPVVQAALGATGAGAFDVNAACAGFLTALAAADAMVRASSVRCGVVIGAEVLSRFVDWSDPKTSVLFADGAGAVVLERSDTPAGLLSIDLGSDGSGASLIEIPAGGSARPTSPETLAAGEHAIRMNGPEVYRAAVRVMAGAAERAAFVAGMRVTDADLVILHQANQRIIDEVGERLALPRERVFSNVARYGNTSAASVPIALCEAADAGLVSPGSRLILSVVGAGLTWASGVLLWTAATPVRAEVLVGAARGER